MGEGYYAERTSKQTVEILRRRGKALETHVDSLKSMIEDLETEALFFDRTASEAAVSFIISCFIVSGFVMRSNEALYLENRSLCGI